MLSAPGFRAWLAANASKITYAALSAAAFVMLFLHADSQPFWADELCQITFSGTTGSLGQTVFYDPHTPPLYDAALYLWYKVAPYGERWLLLLSEGAFAIAVFVTGLVGERIRNRRTGILAATLLALNGSAILTCGWELRPQAFMLLFCVLALYEWVERAKKPGFSALRMLRYAAWMVLSGYAHYFGVLFCGMLFLMDFYLVCRKRIALRYLLSYGLAGVYLPWLRVALRHDTAGLWQPTPTPQGLLELLQFLGGENWLILGLFVLAIVFIFKRKPFVERAPVFVVCVMILLVYVYGRYIAWRSTFWVARYFSALFPCMMIACALTLDTVLQGILRRKRKVAAAVCVCLMLYTGWNTVRVIQNEKPAPYRAAAEWLYAQGDIMFEPDTIVISSDGGWPLDGWREYYITKQGRREPILLVDAWIVEADVLLYFGRVYHSTYGYWGLPGKLRQVLDEHYVLLEENEELYIKVYERR